MNGSKKDFKFDKRASDYDEEFEGKLSEKFYRLVLDNVILTENCRVLDAGCGTGTILKRLNEKCSIDGFGIDVEDNMLTEARKKCPQMDIRLCPCDDTPFADSSFDVIIACMAFHHFPDKNGFAKEAARILRDGGKLYIADPKFPLPVRKAVNTALSIHGIVGEFGTREEIADVFSPYGFEQTSFASEAYAQIVVLTKK